MWGSPCFGAVAEGEDGGAVAAAVVAGAVACAEVGGVFDEVGAFADGVEVVEFECVGVALFGLVVDGLSAEVAGCVGFCAVVAEVVAGGAVAA